MALVSYDMSDSENEINFEEEPYRKGDIKKRVKIEIPSLRNFNTEDEPPKKLFIKTNQNMSSGLFNVLPSPKHEPITQNYKFDAAVVKEKNLIPRVAKKGKGLKMEDDEDEIKNGNYLFSIFSKTNKMNMTHVPVSIKIEVNSTRTTENDILVKTNFDFAKLVSEATAKKLASKICKETSSDITVVDLNSSEFKNNWRMNALKEETSSVCSDKIEGEEPSMLSKKKHQITYLAYQAKVNEEKMKNQWAQDKMTRRQTQAKYGF